MPRYTSILSVDRPAVSYDLATLDDVKEELAITDTNSDAILRKWISRASAAVANFCNRVFPVEVLKEEFWPQRDPMPAVIRGGLEPLQLSRWPIVSVESVTEDGVALVVDVDFKVNPPNGQLVRLDTFSNYPRAWPARPISVGYRAGYATIPDDVADACIRLVKIRYFARTRDPAIRGESTPGAYDVQYWQNGGAGLTGNLPTDVADLLDNYRVPVLA